MFDVEWKPKDFEEIKKKDPCLAGYHHYSVSNYEDVEGFCEWLRYQGATDIKVTKHVPYTVDTVKDTREKQGRSLSETDKRNIQLIKHIAQECYPGNIPYTPSLVEDSVDGTQEYDKTKPILVCMGGDYYPLEHIYVLSEGDLEDEEKELAGCLVLDMDI